MFQSSNRREYSKSGLSRPRAGMLTKSPLPKEGALYLPAKRSSLVIVIIHPAAAGWEFFLLFLDVHDRRVGGQQQTADAGRVLQRDAFDLGRHDHALLHKVAVFLRQRVEAEVIIRGFLNLL